MKAGRILVSGVVWGVFPLKAEARRMAGIEVVDATAAEVQDSVCLVGLLDDRYLPAIDAGWYVQPVRPVQAEPSAPLSQTSSVRMARRLNARKAIRSHRGLGMPGTAEVSQFRQFLKKSTSRLDGVAESYELAAQGRAARGIGNGMAVTPPA